VREGILIAEAGFRNVLKNLRASLGKPVSRVIHEHFIPEVARLGGEVAGTNLTSIPWEWWDGGPKPSNIIYTVSTATKEDAGKADAVHANTWEEGGREPKVREGGIPMNFDLCCYYHGMLSDGAFRAIVGEATPSFVEVWDLSVELFHALPKCIQAGMTCGAVEQACVETFRRVAGNKWDKNYWAIHGHGYHIHEFPQVGSPYLGQTDEYIFEAGNVLAVETIAEASFVLREDGMQPLGEMPMKIYSV
jgi:methionine aminopeptidase